MSSNAELENRLASNLRVSQARAVSALQKSNYDYAKAMDYIISGKEASELILSGMQRRDVGSPPSPSVPLSKTSSRGGTDSPSSTLGKKSLTSMLSFGLSRVSSKDTSNNSLAGSNDDPQPSGSSGRFSSILSSKDRSRALTLTRTISREESRDKEKERERRGRSKARARSTSPFRRRNKAPSVRDPSPAVEALRQSQSDAELSDDDDATSQVSTATSSSRKRRSWGFMPRNSAFRESGEFDAGDSDSDDSEEEEDWDEQPDGTRTPPELSLAAGSLGVFDELTEANTEANAMMSFDENGEPLYLGSLTLDDENDPLGEGINVIRPQEPVFGAHSSAFERNRMTSISAASSSSTITNGVSTSPGAPRRQPTRQATIGRSVHLPLETSRPAFSRDRCTVTLTHGDPDGFLRDADAAGHGREPKTYVVASDLSIESGYAVEWGIGTVLRDGDTMVLVSVQETDSKLDPEPGQPASDRVSKLRNQQERQALGYLLVRQVTSLLQRTKLHCRVICMAVHAKNSRRLLLDLIDYIDPTMVIVGSRGRGQLKGILLGSTSHYLIQKSSVPVMVARRRLRRPARKTAHLQMQRPQPGSTYLSGRKSKLTEALIDKAGPGKVDVDVEHMREEMEREETEEVATRARGGGLREGVGSLGVQGGVGGAVESGDL